MKDRKLRLRTLIRVHTSWPDFPLEESDGIPATVLLQYFKVPGGQCTAVKIDSFSQIAQGHLDVTVQLHKETEVEHDGEFAHRLEQKQN